MPHSEASCEYEIHDLKVPSFRDVGLILSTCGCALLIDG